MINEIKFLQLMLHDLSHHTQVIENRIEKLKRKEEEDGIVG